MDGTQVYTPLFGGLRLPNTPIPSRPSASIWVGGLRPPTHTSFPVGLRPPNLYGRVYLIMGATGERSSSSVWSHMVPVWSRMVPCGPVWSQQANSSTHRGSPHHRPDSVLAHRPVLACVGPYWPVLAHRPVLACVGPSAHDGPCWPVLARVGPRRPKLAKWSMGSRSITHTHCTSQTYIHII